ncbi:transposase [Nocardia sp. NPDC004711]
MVVNDRLRQSLPLTGRSSSCSASIPTARASSRCPILGAMLLAAAGDLRAFPTFGHLAAAAGLVPVPNDSGRRTGNLSRIRHRGQNFQKPTGTTGSGAALTDTGLPAPRWRPRPRPAMMTTRAQQRLSTIRLR